MEIKGLKIRIKNFPVSFFSVVMGLAGFNIALYKMQELFAVELWAVYFSYFLFGIFSLISFFYITKALKFPYEIKKEWNNPIKLSFFPTISISLLLLAIVFLEGGFGVFSRYLLVIGFVMHLIFTLAIVRKWVLHLHFKVSHMNPSWFIPAVGNILVPVAGVDHFSNEISWFFFSIGLFFWIILLVIFFNRIFFHEPLPEKLLPTLFILIAPPAVGFISYLKLVEEIDQFAKILYYFALFLTVLIFFHYKAFSNINFYLSWWAYSFPIAAITIASFLMYHTTGFYIIQWITMVLFVFLSLLILVLLIRTIYAIIKMHICIEE
ncbi:MAG: SLAC1 anion channel family protein [Minisyncoccales bacterium]